MKIKLGRRDRGMGLLGCGLIIAAGFLVASFVWYEMSKPDKPQPHIPNTRFDTNLLGNLRSAGWAVQPAPTCTTPEPTDFMSGYTQVYTATNFPLGPWEYCTSVPDGATYYYLIDTNEPQRYYMAIRYR